MSELPATFADAAGEQVEVTLVSLWERPDGAQLPHDLAWVRFDDGMEAAVPIGSLFLRD